MNSYFPQIVVMALIIIGGMGFIFLHDIFSPSQLKERYTHKWKRLSPSTKIVFYTTLFIIVVGSVAFYFLERNKSLGIFSSFGESVLGSAFQIVSCRSAGFNTV
jgi:trk system potassium uptake protein TrkH